MGTPRFDLARLFAAVDEERSRSGLAWATLAREVGVSTATIRRFERADTAEADGVLALVRWLDVSPETFVNGSQRAGEVLPAGTVIRVDMAKVANALGEPRRGRSRTTIQRLVEAAQWVDADISSLTRCSEI